MGNFFQVSFGQHFDLPGSESLFGLSQGALVCLCVCVCVSVRVCISQPRWISVKRPIGSLASLFFWPPRNFLVGKVSLTLRMRNMRSLIWAGPSLSSWLLLSCCCCCLVVQLCPMLCDSVDCSPPGHQSPLSTEFPRQEYWSGLPFPSPRDLPDPGTETCVSCLGRQILNHRAVREALPSPASIVLLLIFWSLCLQRMGSNCSLGGGGRHLPPASRPDYLFF